MYAIKKTLAGALLCAGTLSTALSAHAGFQVSGTQLLDGNGNPFIMRGINHPHAWFTQRTEQALNDIAETNANTVRIVLSDGQQWSRNSAADVAQVIQWCKDHQLVAVLEVHDATGYGEQSSAGTMSRVVDYWLDIADVLRGQEDYVIINIANEPFGNGVPQSTWIDEHIDAIQRLRDAGLTHTLLVDAANWGQDWQGVMRDNASTVAAADELSNTLFSVHMYEVYQDRSTIEDYVSTFLSTHNLPLIVGEFGADHYGNEVDEASVLAVAEQYDIGYLGWSWSGNSSEVASLDIALNWDPNNLSSWGDFLINSANGLRNTAQTATVYQQPGSSSSSESSSLPSSSSSTSSDSSSSQSSAPVQGEQCDWYGTHYPLCENTPNGWGWEDSQSCVGRQSCAAQPAPYGIVGNASSDASSSASSHSSEASSSSSEWSSSSSVAPQPGAGECDYQIINEWNSGYTAAVRLTNRGSEPVQGWSVQWAYTDGAQLSNSWNAQVSGSNPYTATDMGWNGTLQPGESVEFGVQVSTGSGSARVPEVSGSLCD